MISKQNRLIDSGINAVFTNFAADEAMMIQCCSITLESWLMLLLPGLRLSSWLTSSWAFPDQTGNLYGRFAFSSLNSNPWAPPHQHLVLDAQVHEQTLGVQYHSVGRPRRVGSHDDSTEAAFQKPTTFDLSNYLNAPSACFFSLKLSWSLRIG